MHLQNDVIYHHYTTFSLILSLLLICIAANKCLLPLHQNPTYNIMLKGETLFSEKQLSALRAQLWWVADRDRPFLMKFALLDETVLIQLTDMKSMWAGRFPLTTLLQDKQRFARSLQLKQGRDLLLLFESLLSASDPEATYIFTELKQNCVNFTFRKRIAIFDFSWTLKLAKIPCNPVELTCRELLSPMAAALQAQGRRVELLKKKFEMVEKDYMRKMSEMEKNLYKSPLVQDHQDWKLLLPPQEGKLLPFLPTDEAAKFFQKTHLGHDQRKEKEREKQKQVAVVFEDERKNRAIAKVMSNDVFEMAEHQLNRQLEQERVRMKKEKKIDFL